MLQAVVLPRHVATTDIRACEGGIEEVSLVWSASPTLARDSYGAGCWLLSAGWTRSLADAECGVKVAKSPQAIREFHRKMMEGRPRKVCVLADNEDVVWQLRSCHEVDWNWASRQVEWSRVELTSAARIDFVSIERTTYRAGLRSMRLHSADWM